MHVRERVLITNTARLALASLSNSSLHWRGERPESESIQAEHNATKKNDSSFFLKELSQTHIPLFLFPFEDAQVLTPQWVEQNRSSEKPFALVVPDGNWKQTGKIYKRTPELKSFIKVKLSEDTLNTMGNKKYALRESSHEDKRSTFEAIAGALGVLESPQIQNDLLKILDVKMERSLFSKGLLAADQMKYGDPRKLRSLCSDV